jgi:CRP-like cAMP-binding protein
MTDKIRKNKFEPQDDPSTFMPFKTGSGYYDPAVAKAFFKAFGKREKIAAGTTIFVEDEQSNRQSIFSKPIKQALATAINPSLFGKRNVHRMYLLTDGAVTLRAGERLLDVARTGDVFGEMAVIDEIPNIDVAARRVATAQAETDCTGYSLDGREAQAGLAEQPEFALMLMSVMFERLRFLAARLATRAADDKHRSNRSEPVFNASWLARLQKKIEHATVVRYANRAKIMRAGYPGISMYIVMEGQVAITIGHRIVEKLGPGGVFGEMALVDQSPRAASAVARSECALLSLNRGALISLVESEPEFGMTMMRTVAGRLRYMNSLFA